MQSIAAGVKRPHYKRLAIAGAIIAAIALVWKMAPNAHYLSPHHIAPIFEKLNESIWTIPAVLGIFVLGTAVFFPLTILIISVAIAFSPPESFFLAFAGALCGASFGYGIGRLAGMKLLHFFAGSAAEKISHSAKNSGVLGVTILRLLPIAPLGVIDVSLGIARVPFTAYLTGTVLGLLPGILVFSFLGHSLGRLWRHHTTENIIFVAAAVTGWIGIVFLSHIFLRRWQSGKIAPTQ